MTDPSFVSVPTGAGAMPAYVWHPPSGSGPGIVLVQEIFGVSAYVRQRAADLAALGYVVLAPDVYWRLEDAEVDESRPDFLEQALGVVSRVDWDAAVRDVRSALDHLRARAEVTGGTGLVGFCFGGGLAFNVAAVDAPDVLVSYYGSALPDLLDLARRVDMPSLHHFGDADTFIDADAVARIRAAVTANPRTRFETHAGAGHAFDNPHPEFHHAEAARRAWRTTTEFLAEWLPPDDPLVLGPVLRYVDATSAAVWVEVAKPAEVGVHVGERSWSATTFAVHGHHYALVEVSGLTPGSTNAYTVSVDGYGRWPLPGSPYPPSVIRTLAPGRRLRIVFGSCRTSAGHDSGSNRVFGVDMLRAHALRVMDGDVADRPDLVLFLGDQVYADETSEPMREFIAARRDAEEPPGFEVKDYEEYAHLYELAWSEPAVRWVLSTLPSAMIFDDHDVRDDWNTSARWRAQMESTPWWRERIVGALASYWVYQHLGNLSIAEREDDGVWQQVRAAGRQGGDASAVLDEFAARADARPDSYRWSHSRDLGRNRLVVVDTRAARVLGDDRRSMLDDTEADWLDDMLRGDVDHLLVASSLPFLLPRGLHHLEAWNEAVASGRWGRRAAGLAGQVRQGVDLEHWAAFQDSFRRFARASSEVAGGARGAAPSTVTFLSGDVHHSYLVEVDRDRPGSTVLQAVCSPIRNPLPRFIRLAQALTSNPAAVRGARVVSRLAGVAPAPFTWRVTHGPWFDNMLATLEIDGRELAIRWEAGEEQSGSELRTAIRTVMGVRFGG